MMSTMSLNLSESNMDVLPDMLHMEDDDELCGRTGWTEKPCGRKSSGPKNAMDVNVAEERQ